MKIITINFSLVFCTVLWISELWGQGSVSGRVLDDTRRPVPGILVAAEHTDYAIYTNASGRFILSQLPTGNYRIIILRESDNLKLERNVSIEASDVFLGDVVLEQVSESIILPGDIAIITSLDLETGSENNDQEFSSILASGMDYFENASAFQFFAARFRMRGYDNMHNHLFINGMPMNDLDDGRILWSAWGGLNDVFRNRMTHFSLNSSEAGIGGVGGLTSIDLRASGQRKGTQLRYSLSNRTFVHRLAATYNTGESKSGWALSLSASRRWGNEGFIQGTFFDSYAYFASLEKKWNDQHRTNVVVMGVPLKRGRAGGSFQEMYDVLDDVFYNPFWGYQNGKKRNARVYHAHQPIMIFNHDWQINKKTSLKTSIGMQTGRFGTSGLDWYLAPDPRPDYFRKLPSFQQTAQMESLISQYYRENPEAAQIQWDRLFDINRNKFGIIENANGIEGNTIQGRLSSYVVEEQRFDNNKLTFNTLIHTVLTPRIHFSGGIMLAHEWIENFRVLLDLLGGDFYVDFDQFAIREFPGQTDLFQNDLNQPNRVLYEGDKFGWNYDIITQKALSWGQVEYTGRRWDYHFSASLSTHRFYREGYFKNGRFPDRSLGKSETHQFFNYALKGGGTLKIDGRNYLYTNLTWRTHAPLARFAYLSPRTRDQVVDGLTNEKVAGGEIGYIFRSPTLKGRLSGYYTNFRNRIDNISFYHDEERTFVNYTLTGIDTRHMGIEAGIQMKITPKLEFESALALGEYIHTSRPLATISRDNTADLFDVNRTVYMKNFYVAGMPQTAGTLGARYNSSRFWWASLHLNYFSRAFIGVNPDRRTERAVELLSKEENPELWNQIIEQEEFDSNFTLDGYAGKSWRLKKGILVINFNINNILGNTRFVTGGFEQYRFDYQGKDVNRFPPRYFYAFGRNYSLNASYRF